MKVSVSHKLECRVEGIKAHCPLIVFEKGELLTFSVWTLSFTSSCRVHFLCLFLPFPFLFPSIQDRQTHSKFLRDLDVVKFIFQVKCTDPFADF